jgi:hypothetical protein
VFLEYNVQQFSLPKANFLSNKRLFIFLIGIIGFGLVFVSYVLVSPQVGNSDTKIVLTSGISDENLPIDNIHIFSQDIQRIYCYIDLRGFFGQRLHKTLLVKWYYGSEQFASHYFTTASDHPSIIWIEPSNGETFQQGNYRVEIFSPASLPYWAETIMFQVQ